MKIKLTKKYKFNPEYILRKCGYGKIVSKKDGQVSFARRLSPNLYPRFHAYVQESEQGIVVNLHLDQKQPSYGEHTAHSGEYDGEVVEEEGGRIERWFKSMIS